MQFRELRIQSRRLLKKLAGVAEFIRRDQVLRSLIGRFPLFSVLFIQFTAVQRRKGSAILEIARHGAKNRFRPRAEATLNNVLEIAAEMRIDDLLARIIRWKLLVEEHFHPFPGGPPGRVAFDSCG